MCMKKGFLSILIWGLISIAGGIAFGLVALNRGETISAVWLVIAAISCYAVAYRFYSRFMARKVFSLNDNR